MTQSLLLFTFGPVQSFISEARRTADLFAGSSILSNLADAATENIRNAGAKVIYPVENTKGDAPNVIVAVLPNEQAKATAQAAQVALHQRWAEICDSARQFLGSNSIDATWEAIWARQTTPETVWQVYWVAQPISTDYQQAYKQAKNALDAVKRSRMFRQIDEPGIKDSLSGLRETLHNAQQKPKAYWQALSDRADVSTSMLRTDGRELLDSIGAVKRFCNLTRNAKQPFYSTSRIAASSFLRTAKDKAPTELRDYDRAVETLLGKQKYRVSNDDVFPYDGDLLYSDTLTPERLKQSYGLDTLDKNRLEITKIALKMLCNKTQNGPSPYYAILMMDGDGIGKLVDDCTNPAEHTQLSQQLSDFAANVPNIIPAGFRIYNGGDDVLAFASAEDALSQAKLLADSFSKTLNKRCTLSGGIAIVHHLSPLSAALDAARAAEQAAKHAIPAGHSNPPKNAIAIRVLKRSGEDLQVYSGWNTLGGHFDEMVKLLRDKTITSRLPYDVLQVAETLADIDNGHDMKQAELRRLIGRHSDNKKVNKEAQAKLAADWMTWAQQMPGGLSELGRWLALARFIANGGRE